MTRRDAQMYIRAVKTAQHARLEGLHRQLADVRGSMPETDGEKFSKTHRELALTDEIAGFNTLRKSVWQMATQRR